MNTLFSQMLSIFIAVCLLSALPLAATSGTWTGGSGNWSDTANWAGGIVADGSNQIATFNNAANIEVTVDSPRTNGHINKASGAGQLHIVGGNLLTLQDATKPTFTNLAGVTFIKAPLGGSQAFAKYGASRLVLATNPVHSMTGNIRVNGGELRLDSAGHAIPGIGQIYVASADSAARLHYTTQSDPMSIYPCTFRISGQQGLVNGNPPALNGYGPLFAYGDKIEAAISNVILDTYLGAINRIGQYGSGGKLEFRGAMSGASSYLELYINGVKTNDFIGSNTYGQTTYVTLANNTSKTVLNILGPQRLPKNFFFPTLAPGPTPGGECVIDLHGFQQETTYNHIVGGTLRFISSTPGGSWWADYTAGPGYALVLNQTNILIIDGANVVSTGHIVNREDSQIIVTNNGYLYCGLELLQGFGSGSSVATVADGGYARIFVLRAGSVNPGTFNVEPGGRLAIAAAWLSSGAPGTINLNGGILSDWNDNNWGGGGSSDWIQENINVIVKAGGARIQVDHPSGRVLQKVLLDGGGGGGLTVLGSGVLTLTANNAYTGNTTVESGTLKITAQGAIPAASPVIQVNQGATCDVSSIAAFNLGASQTLKGSGLVVGNLNIQNGATLAPGASVGTTTINGNLATESGSQYEWEKGPGVNNTDKTVVNGSLAINGTTTIKVLPLGGATPDGPSVTNTVFEVSGTLSGFSNLQLDLSSAPGFNGNLVQVGNNVGLVLVPEPAAALLLGALAFLGLRRR